MGMIFEFSLDIGGDSICVGVIRWSFDSLNFIDF